MPLTYQKEEVGFNSAFATAMLIHKWCASFEIMLLKGDIMKARDFLSTAMLSSDFVLDDAERKDIEESFAKSNAELNKYKMKNGEFNIQPNKIPETHKLLTDCYCLLRRALYKHKLIMTEDKNAHKQMF